MSTPQSRRLSPAEKAKLSGFGIPKADLENVVLHQGMPWFAVKSASAITLENDVYFVTLPSAKDSINHPELLSLIAHELVHVGQYRQGTLTRINYLMEAAIHGSGTSNKFEAPAYMFGQTVLTKELAEKYKALHPPLSLPTEFATSTERAIPAPVQVNRPSGTTTKTEAVITQEQPPAKISEKSFMNILYELLQDALGFIRMLLDGKKSTQEPTFITTNMPSAPPQQPSGYEHGLPQIEKKSKSHALST